MQGCKGAGIEVKGSQKRLPTRLGRRWRRLPKWLGLGAGLRSAIYRNLPQFFSDASIQKFRFSPEETSFPPFAVTRHTVRVCVLVCMSFMWQDAFLSLCSQNVIHFWGQ